MILLSVSKNFKFAIFSLLGILFFETLESLENLFAIRKDLFTSSAADGRVPRGTDGGTCLA